LLVQNEVDFLTAEATWNEKDPAHVCPPPSSVKGGAAMESLLSPDGYITLAAINHGHNRTA
jgi:hypothetical protein